MRATIRRVLLLGLLLLLCRDSVQAAHLPIFAQWGGEKIIKVMELPRNAMFQLRDGRHVDVGYRYKQFSVFFVPLWNYDEAWCGYVGNDRQYVDVPREQLAQWAALDNVSLPRLPSLPLWDLLGGKLLLSVVVLGCLGLGGKAVRQPTLPHESTTPTSQVSNG